ncbi:MAG TPA: NAD(P)/FAD-dependent oxidoreductase [Solirubrobacteraceae bacterium]|jgi:flavin-dependent dehydrogenase|nr:NAD(P)/FAD-dependent oxidoreductase [Solirubrobacteraceae bacterium]
MPVRATKRGERRTRLERDCDVLVCGASFAGLAIARELSGHGARVLVIDRYEIGERQTSACGVPTTWLDALDLRGALRQTFGELVVHTPWRSSRWRLPWTFSTFDYPELCALMWEQARGEHTEFETATVRERVGHTVRTDRGELRAPLIVDALGWRRTLSRATPIQPPNARLSRGLEVHPEGDGEEMELWIDPRYIRAGYAWSFPARDEVRVGVGSFWPSHHVREPTVRLARELDLGESGYQGNWIPHQLRPAVEDGVFFVGDSAGHCLPLTAEGIRTAFYFGIACGRELRAVLAGHSTREQALARYAAFSDAHKWKFESLLFSQRAVGRLTPTRAVTMLARSFERPAVCAWAFEHYMRIAPASFAGSPARSVSSRRAAATATA